MKLIERIDPKPVAVAFGLRRGGGQSGGGTVTLSVTRNADSVSLVTPAGATPLQSATPSVAGVLGAADKAKLDGMSTALATPASDGLMSGADKAKLDGMSGAEPGAGGMSAATYDPQGIAGDAFDRANHSGQQAISTVAGLQPALDGKAPVGHGHATADVTGLQAVLDGKAAVSHGHAAGDILSGTIATARLGSGSASASTFLRGDGTWAVPTGSGNVSKVGTPVANRIAYWAGDGTLGHEAGFTYDPVTDTLAVSKLDIGGITLDGQQLADPNASRVLGWDDANGTSIWYAAANGLEFSGANVQMTTNQRTAAIEFVIDGGGSAITAGLKGFVEVPMACTVTAARMLADQAGSIVVDVWKAAYANYPPADADSVTASAPLTINASTKSEDTVLSGWTKAIAAGDILGFNVESATAIRRVTVVLVVTVS